MPSFNFEHRFLLLREAFLDYPPFCRPDFLLAPFAVVPPAVPVSSGRFCLGPGLLSFYEAVERSAGRELGFESQLLSSQGLKPII